MVGARVRTRDGEGTVTCVPDIEPMTLITVTGDLGNSSAYWSNEIEVLPHAPR